MSNFSYSLWTFKESLHLPCVSLCSFLCISLHLSSPCSLMLGWIAARFCDLTMMKATGRAAHEKWKRHNEGWSTETMKKERVRDDWHIREREDERTILSFLEGSVLTGTRRRANQRLRTWERERERERVSVALFQNLVSCFPHRQLPPKPASELKWNIMSDWSGTFCITDVARRTVNNIQAYTMLISCSRKSKVRLRWEEPRN